MRIGFQFEFKWFWSRKNDKNNNKNNNKNISRGKK